MVVSYPFGQVYIGNFIFVSLEHEYIVLLSRWLHPLQKAQNPDFGRKKVCYPSELRRPSRHVHLQRSEGQPTHRRC